MNLRILLVLPLGLTACVEDLSLDEPRDPITTSDTDSARDPLPGTLTEPDAEGEVLVQAFAWDAERWVFLDVDRPDWTDSNGPWTLAFQRYTIMLNGGVSGDAGVEVAYAPDLAYEDAQRAPLDGWITDAADGDDDDDEPDLAFDTWYDYDPSTHVLTPKPGTWFLRSAGGRTYALEIIDYYSDAGDSGYPSLRLRPVGE